MMRFACLIMLIALCAPPTAAFAQDNAGVADAAVLRERLETLQADVESQRSAMAASADAARQRQAQLRAQRDALAKQAVELHQRRLELQREIADVQHQISAAQPQASALADASRRVRQSAAGLAEQLTLYLDEVPGSEASHARVVAALPELQNGDPAEAYEQVLTLIDNIDSQAQEVSTQQTELRTAAGSIESVVLLSIGHVGFAYRVDGRVGIALRSPVDAVGYRWVEDLPQDVRSQLLATFDRVQQGSAGIIAAPMDVTAQMRAEAVVDDASLEARLRSGGLVMFPLGLVAILAAVLLFERFWMLYVRNGSDPTLSYRVVRTAREQGEADALRLVETRRNTVGRTLAAMLRRRQAGQHAMEDSVQEQLLHELPRLQRFLGGIGILAAVAPLLGLLGTVTGIIATFSVIDAAGSANTGMMASGISEALVTTASGLVIAIPALLLLGVMRGRVDRIISEAEKQAATLLNALTHDQPLKPIDDQPVVATDGGKGA